MRLTGGRPEGLQSQVLLLLLLLLLLLQMPGGPLQGQPREDIEAYLALLLSLAEAMASSKSPNTSSQLVDLDPDRRKTILADLRKIILNF